MVVRTPAVSLSESEETLASKLLTRSFQGGSDYPADLSDHSCLSLKRRVVRIELPVTG